MTDTKAIGDALNANLQMGNAIRSGQLNDQISQGDNDRLRAQNERLRSQPAPRYSVPHDIMGFDAALRKAKAEIEERKIELREWMHSNEGFKAVAKAYAEELGVDHEKFSMDIAKAIVDLAETDPDFRYTVVLGQMKDRLNS